MSQAVAFLCCTQCFIRLILCGILLFSAPAQAGSFICTVGSASGISLIYDAMSPTQTIGTGTVALNCAKSGGNSATVYVELGINGGLNAIGNQSRAASGSSLINYSTWRDAGYSQAWNDLSNNRIKANLTSVSSSTIYLNYYISIPPGQNTEAGTYLDTATLKLYQGSTASAASTDISPSLQTVGISVAVAAKCAISSPPGNINFNYTSFQTTTSSASTSFAITCLNNTTYSLSLDATSGTLLGLNYSLALSKSGTQTGNGVAQSTTINGSMASGQSGTCNGTTCTTSEPRTLTLTY